MVMQALHSGRGSKVLKSVFFSLLVLAAFGLVLSDVGGFFSGGVSNNDIAKIGKEKVGIVTFDRTTRRLLSRMGMTPQQAYEMGYIDQILNSEIRSNIFRQIAQSHDIKVGKKLIAKQINTIIQPYVESGELGNRQEVLNRLLSSQGFTEAEFVNTIAAESSAALLSQAVQNKYLGSSEELAQDMFQIENEHRSVSLVAFLNKDHPAPEKPSDEILQGLYNSMKEAFAIPESRDISVGIIDEKAMLSSITISDEEVRAVYDQDVQSFAVPEERVMEMALLPDEQSAAQVLEHFNNGKPLKEAANAVTGNDNSYIPPQAYQEEGLIPEIAELLFDGTEVNRTFGPVQSDLGWHVLTLKDIKPATTRPFDTVKEQLRAEMIEEVFLKKQNDFANEIDDRLAGGATIEELKQEYGIEIISAKNVTMSGAMQSTIHDLDKFGENANTITQLAMEYGMGESSPITELEDGRLAFVHVDEVTPKSYKGFEDVRGDLEKNWIADHQRMNNREQAEKSLQSVVTEEKTLESLAKELGKTVVKATNIKKTDATLGDIAGASFAPIFTGKLGDTFLLDIDGGFAIAKITQINIPEITGKDAAQMVDQITAIKDRLAQESAEETLAAYFESKRTAYKITVNEALLRRAYGPTSVDY